MKEVLIIGLKAEAKNKKKKTFLIWKGIHQQLFGSTKGLLNTLISTDLLLKLSRLPPLQYLNLSLIICGRLWSSGPNHLNKSSNEGKPLRKDESHLSCKVSRAAGVYSEVFNEPLSASSKLHRLSLLSLVIINQPPKWPHLSWSTLLVFPGWLQVFFIFWREPGQRLWGHRKLSQAC